MKEPNHTIPILMGIALGIVMTLMIGSSIVFRPTGLLDRAYTKGVNDTKQGKTDCVIRINDNVADTTYRYRNN